MPAVAIYRVSVTGDNHSYVQWTECEGNTPPPQLINSRSRTIVFEAQGTTAVLNSISKSAAATIEMIGVANSNCSGTGNNESLTTTTTIAITTTASPTTTTTLAPVTISLGYNVSSAATACGASPSNYYARNGYTFGNSTQLFTNSALTAFAPNGYYSNGTDYAIITYAGILADKAHVLVLQQLQLQQPRQLQPQHQLQLQQLQLLQLQLQLQLQQLQLRQAQLQLQLLQLRHLNVIMIHLLLCVMRLQQQVQLLQPQLLHQQPQLLHQLDIITMWIHLDVPHVQQHHSQI